ncbi:DUF5666 domain-containing protein [bacterium RCC_150]
MATMPPGLRTALIAGGIAVALGGGGVAAVWAAGQVPTATDPSPTASATPSPSTPSHGNGKHLPALPRGLARGGIHGEFTVKNQDGTFSTIVTQRGTVQAVSDSSITVKSDDGFTQGYAITSSTNVVKVATPGTGTQGRHPSISTIKASDLKVGDTVGVSGTKSGGTVTATRILAGNLPAANKDNGRRVHPGNGA